MHKQFAAQIQGILKIDKNMRMLGGVHDSVDLDLTKCRAVAGAIASHFGYPLSVLEAGSSFLLQAADAEIYRTTSSKQLFNVLDALVRELLAEQRRFSADMGSGQ
jgi:hypothetical protein